MSLSPVALGATTAAITVPVIMSWMRRIRTLRHIPNYHKDYQQLAKEYSAWEVSGIVLFILFMGGFSYVLWELFSLLAALQMTHIEESRYLISIPAEIFFLPALFLSIFLSGVVLHFLYAVLLGKIRYAEYVEYGNQKHGIKSAKIMRFLASFVVPICLFFTFWSLDAYARVTDSAFVNNRFFTTGEIEYPFAEIERIELTKSFQAPNGNIVRNYYHSIYFADGTKYTFRNSLNELDFEQESEIIDFISSKAGIEVSVDDPYPL